MLWNTLHHIIIIFSFFKHGYHHKQFVGNVCRNLLGQEPRECNGEEDEGGGDGANVLGGAVAEVAGAVALARGAPLATSLLLCALSVEETITGDVWKKGTDCLLVIGTPSNFVIKF